MVDERDCLGKNRIVYVFPDQDITTKMVRAVKSPGRIFSTTRFMTAPHPEVELLVTNFLLTL